MLRTWLSEVPGIALLRSDQVVELLLRQAALGRLARRGDLLRAVTLACDHMRGNLDRRDDVERAINLEVAGCVADGGYGFEFLDPLFDRYWRIEGSAVVARAERAIDCARLLAKIHPYPVIGRRLAGLLRSGHLDVREVATIAARTSQLALAPPPAGRHYAENHLHINGANETAVALTVLASRFTLDRVYYTKDILAELPDNGDLPLIQTGALTIGQMVELLRLALRWTDAVAVGARLDARALTVALRRILDGRPLGAADRPVPADATRLGRPATQTQHLLRIALNLHDAGLYSREFLVRCVLLHRLDQDTADPRLRLLIRLGIHALNILRAYMVMGRNIGLTNFVRFFDSRLRGIGAERDKLTYLRDVAENLYGNGTTYLDAKISPKGDYVRDLGAMAGILDAAATAHRHRHRVTAPLPLEEMFPLAFRGGRPNGAAEPPPGPYHFTIHFLRQPDKPTRPLRNHPDGLLPPRFQALRTRLRHQAEALDAFLNSLDAKRVSGYDYARGIPGQQRAAFHNRARLAQRRIDLTNLVVAIDVAGQETATEPEVYAPAIRFLRRDVARRRTPGVPPPVAVPPERHPPLKLSVHAGEDFSHLITGLRRIDETVRFYGMRAGDRLGHALALGIQPHRWAERCPEVLIPEGEHLDNLIWLHRRLIELSKHYGPAAAVAARYAEDIRTLAPRVYGPDGQHLDTLERAWALRAACPVLMSRERHGGIVRRGEFAGIALAPLPPFWWQQQEDRAPHLLARYHFDAGTRRRRAEMRRLIIDPTNDNPTTAHAGQSDLDVWEALQDALMTEYDHRGLIIECNPSSNVFIAELRDYQEHPIFRWNPPDRTTVAEGGACNRFGLRDGPVRVCVNSDDPAIFCTTLPNEFRMLELAAQDHYGRSRAEAEDWVEALRRYGIEVFSQTHISI